MNTPRELQGLRLRPFLMDVASINQEFVDDLSGELTTQLEPRYCVAVLRDQMRQMLEALERDDRWPANVFFKLAASFEFLEPVYRGAVWTEAFRLRRQQNAGYEALTANPLYLKNSISERMLMAWIATIIHAPSLAATINHMVAVGPDFPGQHPSWKAQDRREAWLLARFALMMFLLARQAAINDCYEIDHEFSTQRVAGMRAGRN